MGISVKNFVQYLEKYSWIIGVVILSYGLWVVVQVKWELQTNKSETYGVIYGTTPIFRGRFNKSLYKYEFSYKGKKYFGTSAKHSAERLQNGSFFRVEFSKENPNNNEIFFDIEYVRKIEHNKNEKITDTTYIPKK